MNIFLNSLLAFLLVLAIANYINTRKQLKRFNALMRVLEDKGITSDKDLIVRDLDKIR